MPQNVKYPEMTCDRADAYSQAADELNAAMAGKGNNKDELIRITKQFNALERFEISKQYESKFSKKLADVFKDELKGDLEMYFCVLYSGYYNQWATWIFETIQGKKDNLDDLSELLFMLTKEDFDKVSAQYEQQYGVNMKDTIIEDIKDSQVAGLLKYYLESNNKYGAGAEKLADYLFEKMEDEECEKRFTNILCNCHSRIYKEVCDKMKEKHGKEMEEIIKKKFGGKQEFAFLDAHHSLLDHKTGVARQLHLCFKGAGTDEKMMIKITQLFGDRMKGGLIQQAFSPFGDVAKDIKSDLSGKDEDLILALWGQE
uniref:Annexin 8 n=1 Tax=Spironucleus barkhanus TaxID=103874 RepID=A0A142C660_SPIBA|nr:annexin 8 [Spironucleus barkhanus]